MGDVPSTDLWVSKGSSSDKKPETVQRVTPENAQTLRSCLDTAWNLEVFSQKLLWGAGRGRGGSRPTDPSRQDQGSNGHCSGMWGLPCLETSGGQGPESPSQGPVLQFRERVCYRREARSPSLHQQRGPGEGAGHDQEAQVTPEPPCTGSEWGPGGCDRRGINLLDPPQPPQRGAASLA